MNLKKIFIPILLLSLTANMLFAEDITSVKLTDEDKQTITDGLNSFSSTLLVVVPQAATQQNVWSDAYIGLIFPSMQVHLGGGFTFGGTAMDMTGFKTAASTLFKNYNAAGELQNKFTTKLTSLGLSEETAENVVSKIGNLNFSNIPDTFFMPTATLDLRLGGLYLPFDLGIHAMMTNPDFFVIDPSNPSSVLNMSRNWDFSWANFNGSIDYLTIGADIRYCIYEGSIALPKISLGGGYVFSKGGVAASIDDTTTIENVGTQTSTGNIAVSFKTQTMYLQAQMSKELSFVTLFGGIRGLVSASTDTWAYSYSTTNDGNDIDEATVNKTELIDSLTDSNTDNGTVTSGNGADGKVYEQVYTGDGKFDFSGIQPQLYAGCSFNFWKFQSGLGVCWDMRNNLWSGLVNLHFKM